MFQYKLNLLLNYIH